MTNVHASFFSFYKYFFCYLWIIIQLLREVYAELVARTWDNASMILAVVDVTKEVQKIRSIKKIISPIVLF